MTYDEDLTAGINTVQDDECFICDKLYRDAGIIDSDDFVSVILDGYPVTRFHTLIIPNRHIESHFDLTKDEKSSMLAMIDKIAAKMKRKDNSITGFNIGWNDGESAGQTVPHTHCHLIPRRDGDIKDPTGGIRGAIPSKRIYK
jgi:ATP adenylyltransferase